MAQLQDQITELNKGFSTAFINQANHSSLGYRPEFIFNNYHQGKKVLVSIEEELARCDEFRISVAFITKSGITPLLQTLKELERKEIPGKILTTDYLMFSEPAALEKLASFRNIEVKMFKTDRESGGFHTKGYIFQRDGIFRIIIGSSNLTLNAMTKNREWNTKILSTMQGEMTRQLFHEFESLWNDERAWDYERFIEDYRRSYEEQEKLHRDNRKKQLIRNDGYQLLKPNQMQETFIRNIIAMKKAGKKKALLLSSTGTGKTLAAAFALREMDVKRALFIVHREQIAKQSLYSFQNVFGYTRTYGLLSGNDKEDYRDFMFATMQTMSKPQTYLRYRRNQFDVIILDECHHAGAASYQKIMQYFSPSLWLGMTASPDTNNYDIYSLFDHNIAYEIRLQQALEEDLLCPFHYFGITDLEVDGEVMDDLTGVKHFAKLVSDARVDYIIEQAQYYGYSGPRVKGLVFCSRKEEAKELCEKFNQRGYRSEVLTGEDSQSKREKVIARLCDDIDQKQQLDYIFTVDIFNEGVDIPEINQVIMLRPTRSPVVFIQQLGRGLRKYEGKEFVVILDFIGNYMSNFMIPIALSGDRSYNKDAMRRYLREGARIIPGSSTIHFDEISKKRIYASIDAARTNDLKLLKESYLSLKHKLGGIPSIAQFKQFGAVDVTKIFEKCGSYHHFLKKYEKEYTITLTEEEEQVIEFLSKKVLSFKRIHELAILSLLIEKKHLSFDDQSELIQRYQIHLDAKMEHSVLLNLRNEFAKEEERRRYAVCILIEKDNEYRLTAAFQKMFQNEKFFSMVKELLDFGHELHKEKYQQTYLDTNFVLYEKYTYEDVCRLLNWERNMNAQNIGGYFYDQRTKTLPVFINYHKAEDAIAYEDRFVSESHLIALSKHPRRVDSKDADHIYKRTKEDQDNRIFLFVRKNKDDHEAKEFYFLGEIIARNEPRPVMMEKTQDHAFEIDYDLDVPIRSDIYDYIINE